MTAHKFRSESAQLEPQNVQGGQEAPRHDSEWDPDKFPTSAKPVFRSTALLVAIIALLCGLVYYSSDHSTPEADLEREAARQEFRGEDQEF